MSDQELRGDVDDQGLNQVVIHSNDPTNVAQIKNRNYDVSMPTLSPSTATESQLCEHTRNMSSAKTNYYFQKRAPTY